MTVHAKQNAASRMLNHESSRPSLNWYRAKMNTGNKKIKHYEEERARMSAIKVKDVRFESVMQDLPASSCSQRKSSRILVSARPAIQFLSARCS